MIWASDLGADRDAGQRGRVGGHGLAVDEQQRGQRDAGPGASPSFSTSTTSPTATLYCLPPVLTMAYTGEFTPGTAAGWYRILRVELVTCGARGRALEGSDRARRGRDHTTLPAPTAGCGPPCRAPYGPACGAGSRADACDRRQAGGPAGRLAARRRRRGAAAGLRLRVLGLRLHRGVRLLGRRLVRRRAGRPPAGPPRAGRSGRRLVGRRLVRLRPASAAGSSRRRLVRRGLVGSGRPARAGRPRARPPRAGRPSAGAEAAPAPRPPRRRRDRPATGSLASDGRLPRGPRTAVGGGASVGAASATRDGAGVEAPFAPLAAAAAAPGLPAALALPRPALLVALRPALDRRAVHDHTAAVAGRAGLAEASSSPWPTRLRVICTRPSEVTSATWCLVRSRPRHSVEPPQRPGRGCSPAPCR